jgi:hypothetical protein
MGGYEMAGFRKNVGGVLARKSYEETLRDTVPARMVTRVDHKRNNLDKMLKDLYSLATSSKVRFYTEYFGQNTLGKVPLILLRIYRGNINTTELLIPFGGWLEVVKKRYTSPSRKKT